MNEHTNIDIKRRVASDTSPSKLLRSVQTVHKMPAAIKFVVSDTIWVIISVETGGLLGVTQQMSQFASSLSSPPRPVGIFQNQTSPNPFAMSTTNTPTSGRPEELNQHQTLFSESGDMTVKSAATLACEDSEMSEQNSKATSTPTRTPNGTLLLQPISFKNTDGRTGPTCWNTKSPTTIGDSNELDGGASHSLQSIPEDPGSPVVHVPSDSVANCTDFMTSKSLYDMNARQASPFSSPSKLLELERSFSSPDAPSPIKPTSRSLLVNVEVLLPCLLRVNVPVNYPFFSVSVHFTVNAERQSVVQMI